MCDCAVNKERKHSQEQHDDGGAAFNTDDRRVNFAYAITILLIDQLHSILYARTDKNNFI